MNDTVYSTRQNLYLPIIAWSMQVLLVIIGAFAASIYGWEDFFGKIATWELCSAAALFASYVAAVFFIAARGFKATIRRIGQIAWGPAVVATFSGALPVIAFCRHGLGAISPWLTLWLTFWLISRTFYFSNVVRNWSNPDWVSQVVGQLLRGLLLLQGAIFTSLLPVLPGVITFVVVFVLFSISGLVLCNRNKVG